MYRALLMIMLGLLVSADITEAQRRGGHHPSREQVRERMRTWPAPVPQIGVRGLYDFERRDFGVGAQMQIPMGRVLRLVPSGELHLGDETTWQANADVAVALRLLRAGGGLALVDGTRTGRVDGDSELGLNLFAGLHAPYRRGTIARPFAEARWTFLEEETPFQLVAGLNVPIGRARR
jgi:hypothetical protein